MRHDGRDSHSGRLVESGPLRLNTDDGRRVGAGKLFDRIGPERLVHDHLDLVKHSPQPWRHRVGGRLGAHRDPVRARTAGQVEGTVGLNVDEAARILEQRDQIGKLLTLEQGFAAGEADAWETRKRQSGRHLHRRHVPPAIRIPTVVRVAPGDTTEAQLVSVAARETDERHGRPSPDSLALQGIEDLEDTHAGLAKSAGEPRRKLRRSWSGSPTYARGPLQGPHPSAYSEPKPPKPQPWGRNRRDRSGSDGRPDRPPILPRGNRD